MNTPERLELAQISERLNQLALECGVQLYLVGGVVRDLLRGAPCDDRDLDIVVEGNAIDFAQRAVGSFGGTLKKFPDFFTAKIVGPAGTASIEEIDFASTRTESYSAPGALPVVTIATISEDLKRRDFTVNAMAIELNRYAKLLSGHASLEQFESVVVDLYGGRADLARKEIRVLHPGSFLDDPTRLFRACRYVARLNGRLEEKTAQLFKAALQNGALKSVSRFRIATELRKMALEDSGSAVFEIAEQLGLLRESGIVPPDRHAEFAQFATQLLRTAGTEPEQIRVREFLKAIALFCGKADAEQRLPAFGLSKKAIRQILEEAKL